MSSRKRPTAVVVVETRAAKRARIPSIAITDLMNNVDLFFYAFIAYLTVLDVHFFNAVFNYKKRPDPRWTGYSLTETWLAVVPNDLYDTYARHNPTPNTDFCYNEVMKEVEIGGSFAKVSAHVSMYYRGMPLFNEHGRFIDNSNDEVLQERLIAELGKLDRLYTFDMDTREQLDVAMRHYDVLSRIDQNYNLRIGFSWDDYRYSEESGYWPGVVMTEYTQRDLPKDSPMVSRLSIAAQKWCDHAEKVHQDIVDDIEREVVSLVNGATAKEGVYWRSCKRPAHGWHKGKYIDGPKRGGVLAVEFRADKFFRFTESFNREAINEMVELIVDEYDTFHLGESEYWACDANMQTFRAHVSERFELFCGIINNTIVVDWDDSPPDTKPFAMVIRKYSERFLQIVNDDHFIRMWIFRNGPLRFRDAKEYVQRYDQTLEALQKSHHGKNEHQSLLPTEV